MKKNRLLTLILFAASISMAMGGVPQAKMTVKVIDSETGKPVSNATVRTRFLVKSHWNEADEYLEQKQQLKEKGFCILQGEDDSFGHGGGVTGNGYYKSSFKVPYTGKNKVLNRWEPWNPMIEVKMRKIKNPVPMVHKKIKSLDISVWDKPIGFDLEKGDWVAPHGKGICSDFFVSMYRRFKNPSDFDAVAKITFFNNEDGVQLYKIPKDFQLSNYKFPYKAPRQNYQKELVLERHATAVTTKTSFDPATDMYLFRVRTQKDASGKIISACYGRIDQRIEIGWGDVLDFEYHFNPVPNECSLEYNGENLLKK